MIDECLRLAAQAEKDVATTAKPPVGSSLQVRVLKAGDYLYQDGDVRRFFYRVEHGAIAVFETHIGRANNAVEIASEGEFVGLGTLEQHSEAARAVVDSSVACVSHPEFVEIAEGDPILRKRQADAIEREFEHRKAQLNGRNHSTPVECVAAFLLAVSRQNTHDGRDPNIVSDSLACGVVAGLLDIDIDVLGHALLDLKHMGLIEELPQGRMCLRSLTGLERLSEGLPTNILASRHATAQPTHRKEPVAALLGPV